MTISLQYIWDDNMFASIKPAMTGTLLSGHSLFSGHVAKSQKIHNIIDLY